MSTVYNFAQSGKGDPPLKWPKSPKCQEKNRAMDINWDLDAPFELEDMLNETLLGLQDLDVPLGLQPLPGHLGHLRKVSGTAIFGVQQPLAVVDIYKQQCDTLAMALDVLHQLEFDFEDDKGFFPSPIKKDDYEKPGVKSLVSLLPLARPFSLPAKKDEPFSTNFLVRYLQDLHQRPAPGYVDDIEPLLEEKKYVPIPVQQPQRPASPVQPQKFNLQFSENAFLPPPQHELLTTSPLWLLPEPVSPLPTRLVFSSHLLLLPVHPQLKNETNFYQPQFLEVDQFDAVDVFSTPQKPVQMSQFAPTGAQPYSLPVKYYSPQRNNLNGVNLAPNAGSLANVSPVHASPSHNPDDTVDANATIAQLTPLKPQAFPNTPVKLTVQLEWSPIISPNAKANENVRKHIQQLTPKRIKKTSLLPPGELDQYWTGPDELKTYTCTYQECGKKFTRRYNVRSHIQTHLCDRPFACSYCPKKFVRQHDLNRHVKGHLEARHCKCPCGKEFARLDALKKHRERNICPGGYQGQGPHSISKPPSQSRTKKVLDELTSEKVMGDLLGQ